MPKRIKPEKPLRESLASHRVEPEEEILTLTAKLQNFVEGREVLVFSALAGALLVLGGLGLVWFLKTNEESLAADRLGVAYASYRETLFGNPLEQTPPPPRANRAEIEEGAQAMARVAEDHESSRAGALAAYLAGNAYLRAGDSDQGIPLLETATRRLPADHPAAGFALGALAAAYEDVGKLDKALDAYTRLSEGGSSAFRAEGLLGRARVLWALDRKEEARTAFKAAREEFPEADLSAPSGLEVEVRDLTGTP